MQFEFQHRKHYITCPTCRVDHLIPQGGAANFPNAFHINNLLDLRKKLKTMQHTTSSTTCPKHNDHLKVYCETCCQVICRDCTISKEHNTHNFYLISECFPKHNQQIQDHLDLVNRKKAEINTVVTKLATREREVLQQGQQLKEEINTHAQQIIDHVQGSRTHLLQQVNAIVHRKTQVLKRQKQQAQKIHTQLKTCQEMIERRLNELNQLQILTEKHTMMDQMSTATQHVDPVVFQPIENCNMQFTKIDTTKKKIGLTTSTFFHKATLKASPCHLNQPSTATLTLHSHKGSPFSLPPSFISSILISPDQKHTVKCGITQSHPGKYNITFTPTTVQDQLTVQVGGVDVPDSPFTLTVIPSPEMRGKPVNIITGLNRPHGIAVYDNGDIVVAEYDANCITVLNSEGRKVKSFGTKEKLRWPRGVAVSTDGHILVTDLHRLQKLTTDGVCVKSVGSSRSGSGQPQFNHPTGITVHPTTGQIFVADNNNNRIQVFTHDLTFSHTITLRGNKELNHPWDVALDNEGCLYVADFGNHCITKLATKGQYITRIGSHGSAPGQLSCPSSLTINNNLVYVSEYDNHRISIFDTSGKFIHCFGKRGSGTGEFNWPFSITVDKLGCRVHVSDTSNDRIIVC